jgi:hypothetical protein
MDFLTSQTNAWLSRQDELQEQWEEAEETVINAIKNGETITYGRGNKYSVDPVNSDLADKVYELQQQIMLAYVNKNDAELLLLIKRACNKEIIDLIDLIGD